MGGIFSSPTPPPPPPLPEPPDPEVEARERRVEALERRRRGRSGTVHTGYQGVLGHTDTSAAGVAASGSKTRLGDTP
jgi:type IV secretory pathway VirB10-like protein